MKLLLILGIGLITFLNACNEKAPVDTSDKEPVQITINDTNPDPKVDIKNYTIITNNAAADSVNAREIIEVKRKVPTAMQRKDSALFYEALSKNFIIRGEGEFINNRDEYVKNRIGGTWTIDTVRYENMVLQFFGDKALLTYRNILKGTDDIGKPNTEYYSWAEIFIKENGNWKVGSLHIIDARVDYNIK